jgi:voltage-gated potassium channel Kch
MLDRALTHSPSALLGWLAIAAVALICVAAAVVVALGIHNGADNISFGEAGWLALMRTLDPGTMGEDSGWGFRAVMLAVTLGGLFVVSSLIGVVTNGMNARAVELGKGRSQVIEVGHTVILGWSDKIFTVLSELALANLSQAHPRIVILAPRDKVQMEDEIRARLRHHLHNTRVICRSGDPLVPNDLRIVNARAAKSVILLSDEDDRCDSFVVKTFLSLHSADHAMPHATPIVGTMNDEQTLDAARIVAGDAAALLNVDDLIARVMAHSCRQSGLSAVYTELMGFAGCEVYFEPSPTLVGSRYEDALLRFDRCSLIGIARKAQEMEGPAFESVALNPPPDTVFGPRDHAVLIAEDDSVICKPMATQLAVERSAIALREHAAAAPERTLILGWNDRGPRAVQHLDENAPAGSTVHVVRRPGAPPITVHDLANATLTSSDGDTTSRRDLDALDLGSYDHVLVLSDPDSDRVDDADTRTLLTLLHVRDIAAKNDYGYSVVTEIEDVRNRTLADRHRADDFIVSDEIVSFLMAQVSENIGLFDVFSELLRPDGCEVYLRPAGDYLTVGSEVSYATAVLAAAQRGESAIGFRDAAQSQDAAHNFGLHINPSKGTPRTWSSHDRVIVIAQR